MWGASVGWILDAFTAAAATKRAEKGPTISQPSGRELPPRGLGWCVPSGRRGGLKITHFFPERAVSSQPAPRQASGRRQPRGCARGRACTLSVRRGPDPSGAAPRPGGAHPPGRSARSPSSSGSGGRANRPQPAVLMDERLSEPDSGSSLRFRDRVKHHRPPPPADPSASSPASSWGWDWWGWHPLSGRADPGVGGKASPLQAA